LNPFWIKTPLYEEQAEGGEGGGGGAAPAAGDDAAAAAAEAAKNQPDAKALQKEIETLRSQVSEKDEAVRYWHGEAKKGAQPKAETPAEDEDKTDLLDLIGTKGAKGLTEFLSKKGFVSGAEVDQRVQQRASEMLRESKLVEEYPDLSDRETPFFKATAVEYNKLVKAGVPKALATEQAARNARLAELEAGAGGGGSDKPKPNAEAERQRRIKAQAGDKGRRGSTREDDPDTVTELEKEVCEAMGVEPGAYKKRQKEVQLWR
jgi:hypothetical protein